MSAPRIIIEMIQLRPNAVLLYSYNPFPELSQHDKRREKKEHKLYSGFLSPFARKKLRYAIDLLIAQAEFKDAVNPSTGKYFKFKVNFITLTLSAPQGNHSDKEIKKELLHPFLKKAAYRWQMKTYVWRAERQKNGNIHFHILSDVFIHWAELCQVWNDCQERLGFISKFRERTGSHNPNSTDIHAVWDIQNLSAYICKYMSKIEKDNQPVEGKLWDCSDNLKRVQKIEFECAYDDYDQYTQFRALHADKMFKTTEFEFFKFPESEFLQILPETWRKAYKGYISEVRNFSQSKPLQV